MTTLSHSPEDVSKQQISGSERRRLPRLNLTTEQFKLSQTGKVYPVADLSEGGLALRLVQREDLVLFPVGIEITGILNLKREKYTATLRICHIGGDLVGCEFKAISSETYHALKSYLDPAILGKELKPIPASEGVALWYHGTSGTDLLFWRGLDGQYQRFALFVLGSFVQWEEGKGASSGRVNSSFERSEVRGVVRYETLLVDADATADVGKLSVAKTLVLSSNLPQDLKKWCVRQLSSS